MGITTPESKFDELLVVLPTEEQSLFLYLREKVKSKLYHFDEGMLAEVPYSKEESKFDTIYFRAEKLYDLPIEKRLKLFMLGKEEQDRYFEVREIVKNQNEYGDEGMLLKVVTDENRELDSLNLKMEQLHNEQTSSYVKKFSGEAMDILEK